MQALTDILVCPVTGERGWTLEGDAHTGTLVTASGRRYPIIGGVPRLLPPALLQAMLRRVYPDVLANDPVLAAQLADAPPADEAVLDTLTSYDHQHLDMSDDAPPVHIWRATWDRFQPGLPPEALADQTVIEIGCGAGRHAWLAGAKAKLLVGLDLSRGVELARRNDTRPHVHYVQADLRHPPFAPGSFDVLYSNGVLHHTPDPDASFAAVAPLLRAGGLASVWVYGLDEMRWSYRMSHLTWLRPVTNRLPKKAQLGVAAGLTAAVEVGLWAPARALRRVGLNAMADRVPYHDAADQTWTYKLRRMFDRLNPPVTHYIDKPRLQRWMAGWQDVSIINADGQGWTARGRRT